MTPLNDVLVTRIKEHGPMPFAAFMSIALYHPKHGYYSGASERIGWRGHYLTAPELDPAYGILWARGFELLWEEAGRPERFVVAEIGPGSGTFAGAVLTEVGGRFAEALDYLLVERMPNARRRQSGSLAGRDVKWVASIDELNPIASGCVFCNEVLDNLPVHLLEREGNELHELCVGLKDGELTLEPRPPTSPELVTYLDRAGISLMDGHRAEIGLAAESLVRHIGARLHRGVAVFVDYGMTGAEASQQPRGNLMTYSQSGVDEDVLEMAGTKDITAHANWTAVSSALRAEGFQVTGPRLQRTVLKVLGIDELHDDLRAEHDAAIVDARGADAVRALSRRQALGALGDPGGLGGLQVVTASKGVPVPRFAAT